MRLAVHRSVRPVALPSSTSTQRAAVVVTVAAMVGLASVWDVTLSADTDGAANLLQRVLDHVSRSGIAFRATRELRAGTRGGQHQGWMDVETIVSPSGRFTWTVLEEGGSERTRNNVFRKLLAAEADAWQTDTRDGTAITLANYKLEALPGGGGTQQIRLKPRRVDPRLVDGTLTVSADGFPVMLEGRLAKSPSFWVKSVSIVQRFARIGGVALPTAIESVADVRIVGPSTFTMRYHYNEVNGRNVSHVVAAPPVFAPAGSGAAELGCFQFCR